jgi:sugar/nucleoside kinase (ribokinase family)
VTGPPDASAGNSRERRQFLSIGSVVIDDIVLPDGRTRMGMLGGGATHAAMGMRVWSAHVALLATLGRDLPEADRRALARAFDTRALATRDAPSPRAWQLYEHDGRRTHVDRTDPSLFMAMCPRPADFPAEHAGASGVRLECDAPDPLREWMARLRAAGCAHILWEPWNVFCRPENRELFGELAPLLDVFSPNLLQARRLTGRMDPSEVLAALLDAGVRRAVVRMGEAGSVVAGQGEAAVAVPAVPVSDVVDVTGAGNAYCGGFLVGLAETGDLGHAGRYGAVSASFALEQFGAMFALEGLRTRAEQRLRLGGGLPPGAACRRAPAGRLASDPPAP